MTSPAGRLAWVDHLRLVAIALVVNMHACVTASHVGDWYITVDPEPPLGTKVWFIFWQSHLQSFFMGLLFFLAGVFARRSIERRGARGFVRERLVRLGVPTLLYMLLVHPFVLLALNPWGADFPPAGEWYARYLATGRFVGCTGPMWFAFALLLFSGVYALVFAASKGGGTRAADDPPSRAAPERAAPSTPSALRWWVPLALGVGLGGATFIVRLWQPVGTAILNFQLCYFAQYIAAFILGVMVARRGSLDAIASSRTAKIAGVCALILGPLTLIALMYAGGPPEEGKVNAYLGGMRWHALGLAMWEQVIGVGLALGAMALCKALLSRETPIRKWLSNRAFGVYFLHTPVLVALTMALRGHIANPFALAGALTVTALIGSFLVADLAKRTPGLKRVM